MTFANPPRPMPLGLLNNSCRIGPQLEPGTGGEVRGLALDTANAVTVACRFEPTSLAQADRAGLALTTDQRTLYVPRIGEDGADLDLRSGHIVEVGGSLYQVLSVIPGTPEDNTQVAVVEAYS